jgi:hypothetical protein
MSASAAASASGSGETEAPSGPSIVNGEKNMDTASFTLSSGAEQATTTPSGEDPNEDNDAHEQEKNAQSEPEKPSIEQQPSPWSEPANDK